MKPKHSARWKRRALAACGSTALLLALAWGLLPRPALYPPGGGWSRLVRDRNGTLLHIAAAPDGRYRVWTPLSGVSPQMISMRLCNAKMRLRYRLASLKKED